MGRFKRKRGFGSRRKPRRGTKRRGRKSSGSGLLTGGKRLSRLPGKRRAVSLPGIKTLIAPTLFTKMYWSVWDYMATAADSVSYHTIRVSSIWDPAYSWSAISAKDTSSRGYTVVSPLYSQYRVYGATVYIRMWNTSNCDVMVQLSSNAATTPSNVSNVDLVQRQEGSVSRILTRVAAGNKHSETSFKLFIPLHKTLGMTQEQYRTDGNTVSLINNSPGVNAYLHISSWNIHRGGTATGVGEERDVSQFGDSSAIVTGTQSSVGYSLRMVQSVQLIRRITGTQV